MSTAVKVPYEPSPDVLEALAKPARLHDERNAEVLPGVIPAWYVIEVYSGAERKVECELVARRFGIFIPEEDVTVIKRGRKVDRRELMFPGYIFVFVWDAWRHRSRIECIDGVQGMLCLYGEPVVIRDDEIDLVRAVENGQRNAPTVREEPKGQDGERKTPRRRPKRSRRIKRSAPPQSNVIPVLSIDEFVTGIKALDSTERNQTLLRTLGLCS
jgi:hypothetical protein